MTCAECDKILDTTNPGDVTRAMRAVVMAHINNCPRCEALADAVIEKLTPEEFRRLTKESIPRVFNDMADPEFRAVADGEDTDTTGKDKPDV